MSRMKHVAIVGATGAVGEEMRLCLEERNFPVGKLTLLASKRSVGKTFSFRGQDIAVEELTHDSFVGIDIALFSAGGSISKEFAASAAAAGCVVIDNSSAFRMDHDVPLVVPEINPQAAADHPRNIIANPNCTTIISLMALAPLHLAFGLKAIIASSYQAVSGSGAQGIAELEQQVHAIANGLPLEQKVYSRQIAFNVIPQVDSFTDNGYTKEELKMLNEGRKILDLPELKVSCTCVRVPVYRSHSVAITAQFDKPVTADAARDLLVSPDIDAAVCELDWRSLAARGFPFDLCDGLVIDRLRAAEMSRDYAAVGVSPLAFIEALVDTVATAGTIVLVDADTTTTDLVARSGSTVIAVEPPGDPATVAAAVATALAITPDAIQRGLADSQAHTRGIS